MGSIFISHTHGDKPIADAFATLVKTLFFNKVEVRYSSSKELSTGIGPGADWYEWIVTQVKESPVALILLTAASIQKPWILWEAGAVAGAAYAVDTKNARVIPISFGLKSSEIPTPFAHSQVMTGTEYADIRKLVGDLTTRFTAVLTPEQMLEIGEVREGAINAFLAAIAKVLLKLPQVVTEATIQEWLDRLQEIEDEGRSSEASVLENWLNVAVGWETGGQQRPLDVRIHRRFGELYTSSRKYADAVRQLELARTLAPRDIFLLRRLGKAYLDMKNTDKADEIIEKIAELDANAFEKNAENAALKARWHKEKGNLVAACDVLKKAYDKLDQSYYLGDLLGQTYLQLKDFEEAKKIYRQLIRTINDLREQNVWTLASKLTAQILCEEQQNVVDETLGELRKRKPSRGDLDTIERGVRGVLEALGRDMSILHKLQAMEATA